MTQLATAIATDFCSANPHALATILDASQTQKIIAARDIFDISGIKLWAQDQPVSQALQRKLLDRQLREPLESCLKAEDGVTARTLTDEIQALLYEPIPLLDHDGHRFLVEPGSDEGRDVHEEVAQREAREDDVRRARCRRSGSGRGPPPRSS